MPRFTFFLVFLLFSSPMLLCEEKLPWNNPSPDEINALSAEDWPEIREKLEYLLDNPFPLILDWRDKNWHWNLVLERLGNIDWPDEIREELAGDLLDFALEMLRRSGYPLHTQRISKDINLKSFSLDDVLYLLIQSHGKIAKTLHLDALRNLWLQISLTYEEVPYNGERIKRGILSALVELEKSGLELEIVDVLREFQVPESELGRTIADYAHHKFEDAPRPPGKWTLEILPPASQTEFADAEKTIPQFVLGESITVRFVLKNESDLPRSLTYYEEHGQLKLYGSIFLFKENEPGEEYDYRRHSWIPWNSKSVHTLFPGEEKTFEYKVPIDWTVPVRGKWDQPGSFPSGIMYGREIPWFCIGEPSRYELKIRNIIPEGAAKLMQSIGYSEDFYEGVIEGRLVFDLVPPPKSRKQIILAKAREEIGHAWDDLPGMLQGYFVAPEELEDILMQKRHSTDRHRLRLVYTGLEMFDTPRAVAEVERMKHWKPDPFQRLSIKILGGGPGPLEQSWDPIRYYLEHVYAGRIIGTAIGIILLIFGLSVFLIRRWRKKKKTATI